jgi:hypothetical protein
MWIDKSASRYGTAAAALSPSMSDDPGSPLQTILLCSPPASPVSLTATTIDPSPLFRHSISVTSTNTPSLTPAKRPRKKYTQNPARRKGFQTRAYEDDTSDLASDISLDLSGPNYASSRSPSPPPIQSTTLIEDDVYERYVTLVLSDHIPFYQISPTIYITQGWDRKTNEPTVHPSI